MEMITKKRLIGQLREKGRKITPQRLAIVDALVAKRQLHPGANLIYEEARKKTKKVSISTVYATLSDFSQQGIIRSLEFDRMENRYEGNLEEHINLVCKSCGKIEDYHVPSTIEQKDVARKSGFKVTDARMEFHGYCRDCLAHGKNAINGRQAKDNRR